MPAAPIAPPPIKGFYMSDAFYIGCGTVTVDRGARKVLVIYDREARHHKLPRGRKDWGESLPDAAERETYEETGVAGRVVPVPLRTRATVPRDYPLLGRAPSDDTGVTTGEVALTEPFALMMHYQDSGALAVVLWFFAEADSAAPMASGTQMADEDYEASWVGYDEAVRLMCNEDYANVVRQAVALAETLDRRGGNTSRPVSTATPAAVVRPVSASPRVMEVAGASA